MIFAFYSTEILSPLEFKDTKRDHFIFGEVSYEGVARLEKDSLTIKDLYQYFKASFHLNKDVVVYRNQQAFETYKDNTQSSPNLLVMDQRFKGLLKLDHDEKASFERLIELNKKY